MLKKIKDQLTRTTTNSVGVALHKLILTINGLHRIIRYRYRHIRIPHLEAAGQLGHEIAAAL